MIRSKRTIVLITTLLGCTSVPALAADGEWQHAVILYGMGAAIDGDATIGSATVPVDMSMSDVFDSLKMGGMAAYRADNGTWSFTGDVTYMTLGGTARSSGGILKGEIDVDQATFMATVGRHLSENLQATFSLSYFDLSADLKLTATGPEGGSVSRSASASADWIDPMVGLQYNVAVADRWRLGFRGDVGGFGIGSDLSYHLLATAHWQASEKVGMVFGYRVIGFDYEDGDGADYQHYDLTEQGPLIGVTISF